MYPIRPLVIFLTLMLSAPSYGSKIEFQATPSEFTPTLTRTLVLHCGLNDTIPNSNNVVGRDLTATAGNAQHVTSVMLTRGDGTAVASVTQYTPAKSLSTSPNIAVTGQVGSSPGERGYLEVTLQYPGETAEGAYICKVNAITDEGHLFVFSQTLNLTTSEPSINDIVKHFSQLETKVFAQEVIIADQANEIKNLKTQMTNQQNTIGSQHSLIQKLQTDDIQLNNTLNIYKHIERGSITTRSIYPDHRTTEVFSHNFTTPYTQTPDVSLAITSFNIHDSANDNAHKSVYVNLLSVDTQGFSIKVTTYSTYVNSLKVAWISFPK